MKRSLQRVALTVAIVTAVAPALAQDTATVTQSGASNVAGIDQRESGTLSVFVRQGGDFNTAAIEQDGNSGSATALQAGDRHRLAMTQESFAMASLGVTQIGLEDVARVSQANVVGTRLYLEQHNGIGSVAQLDQHDGNGLSAFSIQGGNGHVANIEQVGVNADLYTDQEGNGNTLNVRQASWSQERPFAPANTIQQDGSLNAATLSQVGRDFSATIRQGAAGNTATINQHF